MQSVLYMIEKSNPLTIAQHLKSVQAIIEQFARHNYIKVEPIYKELEFAIQTIYFAGEGWIEEDVHNILEAIAFAAKKHQNQVRKDPLNTSYLIHLLSVAGHLLQIGKVRDPAIIIAGLLHDTLEDTETSYEELVRLFGTRVGNFVQEVTDNKENEKDVRKQLQISTAPQKSAGAAQIKLADQWDNLTDLLDIPPLTWTKERVSNYFVWAKEVIDALPWVNRPLYIAAKRVIDEFYVKAQRGV